MPTESELEVALKADNTERYLELQKQLNHFKSIPLSERTIIVNGESIVLDAGTEAPWFGMYGVCFVRVYDTRRDKEGHVEFGVGNETLPILGYVRANRFYNEWPD